MKYCVFFLSLVMMASCSSEPEKPKVKISKKEMEKLSVEMNNWDAERQKDEIEQYISRRQWEMKQTSSGMYYMTMKEGRGAMPRQGQTALVSYRIYLLDGTECYKSEEGNPKEFTIGEDYVESGLHEGILLMQVGGQMRFILPSHLAHGLTGDQEKIPPRSSVIYEVELLGLR